MEDELIMELIYDTARNHLHKWFNELGLEGTTELIERQSEGKVKDVYMNLLRQRGLVK